MSLFITSLNSGSNGNCYYVGNSREAVLVDAGISCRETEKRMTALGLSMQNVKAIFVSHEHTDHIKGLPVLAEKYKLPVYITELTLKHSCISSGNISFSSFKPYESIQIGELHITAFPKYHDAEDPHSFIIRYNNTRVGVFTDIGKACSHVRAQFRLCNAAFLEANYDEAMLDKGNYPIYLKNRIRGGKGHLSNKEALEIFIKHKPAFMSHVLLSHLSKENNHPDLARELFQKHAKGTMVVVASRYEASPVFKIMENKYSRSLISNVPQPVTRSQLSLFEEFQ